MADPSNNPSGPPQRPVSFPHQSLSTDGEWEMLQAILRRAPSTIAREFLLHYYISAKSWPLVLLIGRPGVGKRHLFKLLAEGIGGCTDGHIRLLPAQHPWQGQTGSSRYFDTIQGRFNTMAFLDLLAEASIPGNEGQTYFLALDQSTPEELSAYMDLYLTSHREDVEPPPLPPNLYLTAILSTTSGVWCLPLALLTRVGIVEVSVPLGEEPPSDHHCPPVGWQRLFLRDSVRDPEQAHRRLQRLGLLREFYRLLAPLQASLGAEMSAAMEQGLLVYATNSFTAGGHGLLAREQRANLRQAIDLQLAQWLLPCIAQHPTWPDEQWEDLQQQLEGVFPQGHARARRILLESKRHPEADTAAASVPVPPTGPSTPATPADAVSSERKDP